MIHTIEIAPDIYLSHLCDKVCEVIRQEADERDYGWIQSKIKEFFEKEKQQCHS